MRTAARFFGLSMAFLVAACGGDSKSSPSGDGGTPVVQGNQTTFDTCDAFTQDIAQAALGGPVKNPGTTYLDGCEWKLISSAPEDDGMVVRIYPPDQKSLAEFVDYRTNTAGDTPIPGLGQAAFINSWKTELQVYLGKDLVWMSVPQDAVTEDKMIAAMKQIIAKIPT